MDAPRYHYIDWLRVLAVLLLFPFHTSRVFNEEPFYVKADELSTPLSYVLSFIDAWHMPLLFFLAGASTLFAMRKRTRRVYVGERLRRLGLPLLFGLVVLIPPQTWYGGRFNSDYESSYLRYLAGGDFLEMNIRDGGDYYGGFGVGHLWFILFLFVISLLLVPLLGLDGRRTQRWRRASQLLAHPAGWLVAGLALYLAEGLPDVAGKNLFYYLVFFALGYAAMSSGRFMESAERWRWLALAAGAGVVVWWVASWRFRTSLADPSLGLAAVNLLGMTARWLVIVGLLGVGRRYLDRPSKTLAYLAEASYPIYILHQTVIVVVAFYVVGLAIAWPLQWIVVFAAGVAGTFLTYEVVRRVEWARVVFGMRPLPLRTTQRTSAPMSADPAGDSGGRRSERLGH
jgi:peptidoglycan/LPS O-acetylase OafA/YrhL